MLTAVVALAITQAPADSENAWFTLLRQVSRMEQASLCVDIDVNVKPRVMFFPKRDGRRGLDRLAAAIGRSRTVVDGVQIFRRHLSFEDVRTKTPHQHAMDFLQSLDEKDRQRLAAGELGFSELSFSTQKKLTYSIVTLGNGLGDSMFAHYPGRLGMRLILEPKAEARSRSGDGMVSVSLDKEASNVPVPDITFGDSEPLPIGRQSDGALQFGDGQILTLAEIANQASRTFGGELKYDERLADTKYFLSGSFTKERLINVIRSVTTTVEVVFDLPDPNANNFTVGRASIKELTFGRLRSEKIGVGDLTYSDVLDGRGTTFNDLYSGKLPRPIQSFIGNYRIQPTDTITIKGEMYLAFAAPGLASLPVGDPDSQLGTYTATIAHLIKIGF